MSAPVLGATELDTSVRSGRATCLAVLILGACLDLRAERLPIKIYTTADGLAHNEVTRIVRDSGGLLWFCTADGLSRFDGYTFTNFGSDQGLPQGYVNDLLETRTGEYWVATDSGLVHFDPKGTPGPLGAREPRPTSAVPMFSVIVPDDRDRRASVITVLREGRDGTVWIGTEKGLYRLEHANGQHRLRSVDILIPNDYPGQHIVADLLEDSRGALWIATHNGLYRRWPDGSAARYTQRDGLPNEFLQDLLEDHEGHLWAATRQGGFFRFRADATRTVPVVDLEFNHGSDYSRALPTYWVFQLFQASDRRFWIATARGLVEFFPTAENQRRFRSYAERNGLSYYDISALNEDLRGNLWLGTGGAGAMKLTRGGFDTYGEQDGIKTVNALFEDRAGNLCFRGNVIGNALTSVFEGARLDVLRGEEANYHLRLGCFDGQRFDWFKPTAITSMGWVTEQVTLQARSGEWWLGTGEGLYRFPAVDSLAQLRTARPKAVYTVKDGLASLQVYRLFEDSRGDVWISTTSATAIGLARWERLSKRVRDLSHADGLPSLRDNLPRSFGEDRAGNVWIGFSSGLARDAHGKFTFFTEADGLPPGPIVDIHVDGSSRLWLASARSGLVRVDDAGGNRPVFVNYTTAQGLSSNNVEIIAEDRTGQIYAGGGYGLDSLDPSTGRVKHFTTADGLPPGTLKAGFLDRHGVLWFGTSRGLARYAPAPEAPAVFPPVLITGLRVRGTPQLVSALGEQEILLPDLAPNQNQLQIEFVGLGFGSGEVLRYQYRLEGADADWSALDQHRTVTYASLSPGRYQFMVRAVSSDGTMSVRPATIGFTVQPPVWLRGWFLALAALAVGMIVHTLYRLRVARLLELADMRTRIATDLHDDIGANLTRIALLSEVARRTHDEGPLGSIARIARESVESMSDIVWAINPRRESLLELTRRARQHADEIFTLRNIALRFNAPGAEHGPKLGVEVRRDLLLIFKEAVNNAARHSRCSAVEIELRVERSRLVLGIVDDGDGFDTSVESEGQGLTSMRRRAQRLEGTLEIASHRGGGTSVTLEIPI